MMLSRTSSAYRPYKCFFFLVLCLSFFMLSTTSIASTTPTAEEILEAYLQNELVSPGKFQVTATGSMDGDQLGKAVLGWSGGTLFSLSVESPHLPMPTAIQYGLRPSGFSIMKMGSQEMLRADLVGLSIILETIPDIFNMPMLHKLVNNPAYTLEFEGETEVSGRRAYILSITMTLQDYVENIRNVYAEILANPVLTRMIEISGFSVEEALLIWDEEMAAAFEVKSLTKLDDKVASRLYIDAQDYLLLGYDTTTQKEAWEASVYNKLPVPSVQITVESGPDGHITRREWRMNMILPADFAAELSLPPTTAENLLNFEVCLSIAAINNVQLLEHMGIYLAVDPMMLELEGLSYADEEVMEIAQAIVGEHSFTLDLKWDLTKEADPKLVENAKLLSAEKAWQIGLAAYIEDDQKTALKQLSQLARLVPEFIEPHMFLSELYYKNGQLLSCIFELEQVIMLDPYNAYALNNAAYYYADHEMDVERALELAIRAYELKSYDAAIVDTLGWAFFKNGMFFEAALLLEESLELSIEQEDPEKVGFAHYHLAAAYAALERWDEAISHLEQAVELDPALEEAQELLAELKS